jgi:hypothetical protein
MTALRSLNRVMNRAPNRVMKEKGKIMSIEILIVVVVVILLLGGGGYYWRR